MRKPTGWWWWNQGIWSVDDPGTAAPAGDVYAVSRHAFERLTLTASEEQARMASEGNRSATLCWRRFRMIYARRSGAVRSGRNLNARSGKRRIAYARQASEIRQHVLNTTRLVNIYWIWREFSPAALI